MPRKGLRWELIALSAVLTLAVLSLAYNTYESVGVRKPLEQALMLDVDVSAVAFGHDGKSETVIVTLSHVANLSATYSRLASLVRAKAGDDVFALKILDTRDSELQDIYHSVHYYLEEASVRGNFGAMIEACGPILERSDATEYKITVDSNCIYVQIESATGFLYEVLQRADAAAGGGVT